MHLVMFRIQAESANHDAWAPERGRASEEPGFSSGNLSNAVLGFEALDFSLPGVKRLGALIPPGPHAGDIIDLNRALAVKLAAEDVGTPEAEADSLLPSDMMALLELGSAALEIARSAFEWVLETLERFDGPDLLRGSVVLARRRVQLCAPIPAPRKLIGVANNYPHRRHQSVRGSAVRADADDGDTPLDSAAGRDASTAPALFLEASSAVIGEGDEIVLPDGVSQVDYGGTLAVVIGKTAHRVSPDAALDFVAGYTVGNDVTAHLIDSRRHRTLDPPAEPDASARSCKLRGFLGSSCDTFTPLGPALVTCDEIDGPGKLSLRTLVSGETRQLASTADMRWGVAELISFASHLMALAPGDVIMTGTPQGVGADHDPQRWLREGDVVDVEIEHLGRLRSYVTLPAKNTPTTHDS